MSEIIKNRAQMNDWLETELPVYGRSGLVHRLFMITEGDILAKHQRLLRHAEYHTNAGHKLPGWLFRVRLYRLQNKYGMHIPLNTCGKGLRLIHLGPRLLNGKARLGENCILHINTYLVAGGTNDEAPQTGDGVIFGIGAIAFGGIRIADNIAIGANSVVNKDFPEPGITIAGSPAKKISDHGAEDWKR